MAATATRQPRGAARFLTFQDVGRDVSLLVWGMVLWDLGFGLYTNLWPIYIERLGASPFQIGLVIGLQGLMRLVIMLPSGILADRWSRRSIIWIATGLSIPSVLIYGIAQVWWHLLFGIAFWALSNASIPALSSYTAQAAPPRARARAFALVYTVGPAGAMIVAPIIGGFLSDRFSIRLLFFPAIALYALSTYVFSRISERPPSEHHAQPATYRDAFRHRAVRIVSLLQLALLAVLTMGVTFLPNYLHDVHGQSLSAIGRYGALSSAGAVGLSLLIGKVHWVTPSRGIAIATAAVGAICVITILTGNPWVLSAAFVLRGGFMVAWSLFAAVLGDTVPERLRGRAFALAEFLGGIGYSLAPFVAGPLYARAPELPLIATAAGVPLLLVAIVLTERRVVRPLAAQLAAA